jgi:hypothetical protein
MLKRDMVSYQWRIFRGRWGTIPRAQEKIFIENCKKKLFRGALCQKATMKIPGPKTENPPLFHM